MYPVDLKYTRDHEWVRLSGADAQVGITEYAQKQLGDVVYLELPEVGRSVKKGDVFGTIESVKAVSELFAPLAGEVVAVNDRLDKEPGLVNSDPYGDGWMIRIHVSDPTEVEELMTAEEYEEYIEKESAH